MLSLREHAPISPTLPSRVTAPVGGNRVVVDIKAKVVPLAPTIYIGVIDVATPDHLFVTVLQHLNVLIRHIQPKITERKERPVRERWIFPQNGLGSSRGQRVFRPDSKVVIARPEFDVNRCRSAEVCQLQPDFNEVVFLCDGTGGTVARNLNIIDVVSAFGSDPSSIDILLRSKHSPGGGGLIHGSYPEVVCVPRKQFSLSGLCSGIVSQSASLVGLLLHLRDRFVQGLIASIRRLLGEVISSPDLSPLEPRRYGIRQQSPGS